MKLLIRKIEDRDLPVRVNWINHPSVANNMFFDCPADLEKTKKWYESLTKRNRIDLVCENDKQEHIGMFGLTNIDVAHGNAELYVIINPDTQGKGFGKTLTMWCVNYGFLAFNLNKIYLFTKGTNQQAGKLYNMLGFVTEGVLRKHKFKNGEYVDHIVMGMLRSEWEATIWNKKTIDYHIHVD